MDMKLNLMKYVLVNSTPRFTYLLDTHSMIWSHASSNTRPHKVIESVLKAWKVIKSVDSDEWLKKQEGDWTLKKQEGCCYACCVIKKKHNNLLYVQVWDH